MTESVLTKRARLKYRGKFITVQTAEDSEGLVGLEVSGFSPLEQRSVNRMVKSINGLLSRGVISRHSIEGTLKRTVGVDPDLLKFVLKVVATLPLKT